MSAILVFAFWQDNPFWSVDWVPSNPSLLQRERLSKIIWWNMAKTVYMFEQSSFIKNYSFPSKKIYTFAEIAILMSPLVIQIVAPSKERVDRFLLKPVLLSAPVSSLRYQREQVYRELKLGLSSFSRRFLFYFNKTRCLSGYKKDNFLVHIPVQVFFISLKPPCTWPWVHIWYSIPE